MNRAKLVRIGNSRGVRLPKPLIDQAALEGEVDLRVRGNTIVITSARPVRQGWAEAARAARAAGDDARIETPPTGFDATEWRW